MCGIAGILDPLRTLQFYERNDAVKRMCRAMTHRGPDHQGLWTDESFPISLGHRRLSIIDLSPQGFQPMISHNGQYVIVYNGEIYNFLKIQRYLEEEGCHWDWRGHSDTEILLEAIGRWGISKTLKRLNGMFAFAVWARRKRVLYLARDRLGKKPLYYGWNGQSFIFASELKAVKAAAIAPLKVNIRSLPLFLRFNYIPSPYSIYQDIYKLPPACMIKIDVEENHINPDPDKRNSKGQQPERYWHVKDIIEHGARCSIKEENEALIALEKLIRNAVSDRMVADVPIGAFLSGGIDSSVVVAFMQANSFHPVKTYSIGFYEKGNEAEYAKAVAKHLGTDHTELYITAEDVLKLVSNMGQLTDEPHSDTAVIPTYLLAQMARKDVTVCLSGDGGDELFMGYPRYLWQYENWLPINQKTKWMGALLRREIRDLIYIIPDKVYTGIESVMKRVLPFGKKFEKLSPKLHDFAERIRFLDSETVYRHFVMHCHNPSDFLTINDEPDILLMHLAPLNSEVESTQRMVYFDLASRLPDSIVSKVDRATMSASLETRSPLLDYRLVELSARIPIKMKIHAGNGKWILRKLLNRYVPQELVDRPKKGFKMPISKWLRGPLKGWAEELLDEHRLKSEDFFKPEIVQNIWKEHKENKQDWHYQLWDILMFQQWLEKN